MNDLIKKIEISSFRSIEKLIIPTGEINVFCGSNDIGKSNILKALNLFFNNQTDFLKPLKFEDDFNMISRAKVTRSTKMKQLIKIRIYLNAPSSYKTLTNEKSIYIERQFDRSGERFERYSTDDSKKKSSIKRIINKIKYIYIPALKGEEVLQHLLSLIGEKQLITDEDITKLNDGIFQKTKDLKVLLSDSNIQIGTSFGLPTLLSDFWQKLSVNTSYEQFEILKNDIKGSNSERRLNASNFSVSLLNRGEGLKSKYIPPLLKWLDNNDKTKDFIWGIDEPENSLEFGLSDSLSRLFYNDYATTNQIFITSHSLAFINPPKDVKVNPKIFRVKKDKYGGTQWFNMDDIFKNQSRTDLFEELGILIAQKEFINEYREVVIEKETLKNKLKAYSLPIIVVEGKTDKWILEHAWKKLFPTKTIPFEIYPSGSYIDEDDSAGSAEQVRRSLELISPMTDGSKVIVGIFDNDKEGNDQFKGLNKKIFEAHTVSSDLRKHKTKKIFGLLLPAPKHRTIFVGSKINQRYFTIEHYFADEILSRYKLKGDKVTPDSNVFIVTGNKSKFAKENINELVASDFNGFKVLFDKIDNVLNP